jgi:membrane fusion protein (multidrug efflux system)
MATTVQPQKPPPQPPPSPPPQGQQPQEQQAPHPGGVGDVGQGSAAQSPAKKRRSFVLPIAIVVAIIGIIWGVRTWNYSRAHESTDDAQVDGHIIPVLAKVGGYVTLVSREENASVKEGDTLVRIDDRDYRMKVEEATADVAAAQAAVAYRGPGGKAVGQAFAQLQTAKGQSVANTAQIQAARANYDKALADLQRYHQLAAQQIISKQMLDAAQAAADAAAAQLLAAQGEAAASASGVTGAEAGVRLAQARLASALAERDNAALQLSYTTMIAPATGVMSRKQVEVGQLVQPGQTLFSIVADTGIYLTANYKETQLNDVKVGQPVDFTVDAYGGCTAHGKVESLSPATGAKFSLLPPDNATGNFTKVVQRVPIRIQVTQGCGPDRPLRPGMSVDTHIVTRS